MGLFDLLNDFFGALNNTVTSDDLSEQVQGLAPRRTKEGHLEVQAQQSAIDANQRRIDILTLQPIAREWNEIEHSFSQNKDLTTKTVGDKMFWNSAIQKRIWKQNLQAIQRELQRFLELHNEEISDIALRDYECFPGHSEVETRNWHKMVFRDIDRIVNNILRDIDLIINMRDNPGLSFESQTDSRAAQKMADLFNVQEAVFRNYQSAVYGMSELINRSS